ncbi:O-antigen ligase family protein [Nocardioides montaniterrae]
MTSRLRTALSDLPADRLPLAVGAVIVVLPFGNYQVPGAGMSLIFVVMMVPGFLAVSRIVNGVNPVPPSFVLLGLALGIVSSVLSMANADDPTLAVHLVISTVVEVGYALAIGICFADLPDLERYAVPLLVVVAAVIAGYALSAAGSLKAADGGSVVNGRLLGPFAQPNELGMFCAAMLPVAIVSLTLARSTRLVVLMSLCAITIAAAWGMSMSRGGWIGGVFALVCLAIFEPTTRRTLGGVAAVVASLCVAAVVLPSTVPVLGIIGDRIKSLGDPSQNPYDARPAIWTEAWRQAAERPWLGAGPGGYTQAASSSASAVSADPPAHAHDIYLTLLAERGVVGVLFGTVVLVGLGLVAYHHMVLAPQFGLSAGRLRSTSVAVLAALTAVGVHGLLDMPLRNPIVAGLVWTLLGFSVAAETAPSVQEARWRRYTITAPSYTTRAGVF